MTPSDFSITPKVLLHRLETPKLQEHSSKNGGQPNSENGCWLSLFREKERMREKREKVADEKNECPH